VIETAALPKSMFINDCLCFFTPFWKPYPKDHKAINFTLNALKKHFFVRTPTTLFFFCLFLFVFIDQTVELC